MQTEQIKLSRIRSNTGNPRTITSDRFNRLVDSILVFPKMLELRPIVHDGKFTVLGGNHSPTWSARRISPRRSAGSS